MDVRIGVSHSPREIELDVSEDGDAVAKAVEKAIAAGDTLVWLTDKKGRRVGVPAAKIAYVEIGSPSDERRVGFGAP